MNEAQELLIFIYEHSNLSINAIAKSVGCSRQTASGLMNGSDSRVNGSRLLPIIRALAKSYGWTAPVQNTISVHPPVERDQRIAQPPTTALQRHTEPSQDFTEASWRDVPDEERTPSRAEMMMMIIENSERDCLPSSRVCREPAYSNVPTTYTPPPVRPMVDHFTEEDAFRAKVEALYGTSIGKKASPHSRGKIVYRVEGKVFGCSCGNQCEATPQRYCPFCGLRYALADSLSSNESRTPPPHGLAYKPVSVTERAPEHFEAVMGSPLPDTPTPNIMHAPLPPQYID